MKANFVLKDPNDERWKLELANCSREHAETVKAQLESQRPGLTLRKKGGK